VSGATDRKDVNQTYLQPFLNYNLNHGLALGVVMEATANWNADQAWTAPLLFGVSKVAMLGKRPVNFSSLPAHGGQPGRRRQLAVRFATTFMFRADIDGAGVTPRRSSIACTSPSMKCRVRLRDAEWQAIMDHCRDLPVNGTGHHEIFRACLRRPHGCCARRLRAISRVRTRTGSRDVRGGAVPPPTSPFMFPDLPHGWEGKFRIETSVFTMRPGFAVIVDYTGFSQDAASVSQVGHAENQWAARAARLAFSGTVGAATSRLPHRRRVQGFESDPDTLWSLTDLL